MTGVGDDDPIAAAPPRKSAAALRTIGELAAETGIATHVLRYWERNVPALQPMRLAGGRRYYRAEDAALVRRLHRLVTVEGYTLEGAARAATERSDSDGIKAGDGGRNPSASAAAVVAPSAPAASVPPIPPLFAPAVGALFAQAANGVAGAGVPRDRIVALRDRLKAALAA